jgi:hypothetical protein
VTTTPVRLAPDITFHELPFCGVLLDTRQNVVFRLSPELTGALRRSLFGPLAVGPYESLVQADPAPADTDRHDLVAVLRPLAERGLIVRPGDRDGR